MDKIMRPSRMEAHTIDGEARMLDEKEFTSHIQVKTNLFFNNLIFKVNQLRTNLHLDHHAEATTNNR
jgi:hypothetical protein